jgi:hypothetical protein
MPNGEEVIHGQPASPQQQQEMLSLRMLFDAKASVDRLDAYARWLFGSATIVGALGAGLSNSSLSKLHGAGIISFAVAVSVLGVCLVAASLSIAPHWEQVKLTDLESMRSAVNDQFVRRRVALCIASLSFACALLIAAISPLLSLSDKKTSPVTRYTLNEKGDLDASFEATNLERGSVAELQLLSPDSPTKPLLKVVSTVDESGQMKLIAKRPGVVVPPIDLISCVRKPPLAKCTDGVVLHILVK